MTDSDMCPAFLQLEPIVEIKLEPFFSDFESNGRSPKSNCNNPLIDQFGDPLTKFCSMSDEEKEVKMESKIEESEINLIMITEEVEDNSDMLEQNIPGLIHSKEISKNFQCHICGFETIKRKYLENHMLVHKDPSEIQMFKCPNCPFETKRKGSLVNHMIMHKNPGDVKIFKCELCHYENKCKFNLKTHMLVYHNCAASVFKCKNCNYTTQDSYSFKCHVISHKDQSEVRSFESNERSPRSNCSSLIDQLGAPRTGIRSKLDEEKEIDLTLVTEEIEDNNGMSEQYIPGSANLQYSNNFLKNFQCSICDFRTTKRSYLKRHMIIHQDPSEIKMFKCLSCPYEFKRKKDLKEHTIIHKDPDDLKMFRCNFCSYESKSKRQLMRHLNVHNFQQNQSKPFQCPLCPYKAKFKFMLNSHSLVHRSDTYKCDWCDFTSIHEHSLKRHINGHKSTSEMKIFKCLSCPYEGETERDLENHMIIHKYPGDLKTYSKVKK